MKERPGPYITSYFTFGPLGTVCPYCQSTRTSFTEDERWRRTYCNACSRPLSVEFKTHG